MSITDEEKSLIIKIARSIFPDNAITFYIFGSRAKNSARESSDLDLMIKGNDRISFGRIGFLKEAFDESNLTYKVDVVDYYQLEEHFRENILKTAIKLN